MKKLAVIAAALLVPFALLVAVVPLVILLSLGAADAACPTLTTPPLEPGTPSPLTEEQAANARLIVTVTQQFPLPKRAAVIALATALQESALQNLDHGDAAGPDSRGLFQQMLRFYGPGATIPDQATRMFLTHLAAVPQWATIPLADAAQAVQRSAFPALYARHEPQAQHLADQLWAGPDSPAPGDLPPNCATPTTGPVFILGDSLTVRATAGLRAALPGRVTIDAQVGRTLTQGLEILHNRAADYTGARLIIALCTNYGGSGAEFARQIDETMTAARDAAAVEWVTCSEWHPAVAVANLAIRAARVRYPAITIAEWAEPSRAPGLLDPDGVHPTLAPGAGVATWTQTLIRALPPLAAPLTGGYTLPVDLHWYRDHPAWFTAPHHAPVVAIDLPIPAGTTIYAVTGGAVVVAPTGGDCGQGAVIDGDDGYRYTYCHGRAVTVPAGAHVNAGDPIMISGTTGRSTGPHLHFQIQRRRDGALLCPHTALAAWAAGQPIDLDSLPTHGCTT